MESSNTEEEKLEFTGEYCHALICILLKITGPIGIPKDALDSFPEGIKWQANLDETNQTFYISLPQKRKRGIIKPQRKLILPRI